MQDSPLRAIFVRDYTDGCIHRTQSGPGPHDRFLARSSTGEPRLPILKSTTSKKHLLSFFNGRDNVVWPAGLSIVVGPSLPLLRTVLVWFDCGSAVDFRL